MAAASIVNNCSGVDTSKSQVITLATFTKFLESRQQEKLTDDEIKALVKVRKNIYNEIYNELLLLLLSKLKSSTPIEKIDRCLFFFSYLWNKNKRKRTLFLLFFFINYANIKYREYSLQRDETVVYLKKKENKIIYSNEIWKYALNTLNKQSQLIRLYKKKKNTSNKNI